MNGKISKIDPLKSSSNKNQLYQRVHFQIINNDGSYFYSHTDLVTTFRNYGRWKDKLIVGNILGNLRKLSNGKIDADSEPTLLKNSDEVKTKLVYDDVRNVMVVVPDTPENKKLLE